MAIEMGSMLWTAGTYMGIVGAFESTSDKTEVPN